MNYVSIAIGWCLLAQAPGNSGVDPIRVPARPAPPAQLGDMSQDVPVPADEAPAGDAWDDPPAADGSLEMPDRYGNPPDATADPPAREQEPPATYQEPPAREQEPPGRMAPLGNARRQRLRPPELIAEALENPRQEALTGTPIGLSDALARAANRQQQLTITQSYWRLATAQAQYHWALAQRDVVGQQTRSQANLAGARAAEAAAEADVRDAQLAVEQAQQQLAELLGAGGDGQMPLATDRPHVGDYRTHYERIFSSQPPPPRIRLIHRTLPVRRKAIDARADAVVAAGDAVDAAGQQFRDTGQGFSTLLDTIQLLGQQRSAFIAEVRDYNLDIAEYAFAVAPAGAGGDTLVSMLIRTRPPPAGAPTRAPQGTADPSIQKTFRKPPDDKSAAAIDPDDWTTYYPGDLDASAADDPGVYQGLLAVANHPLRVQKLGNLLHWDRNLPPDSGDGAALADCLRSVSGQQRLAVIRAYWLARERAAGYQAVIEEQEQLMALQAIAVALRNEPGIAEAGVRLQAARRAAQAAAFDAQLNLMAAQFELMRAMGRPLEESWLVPSTPPQSGRYQVSARARHVSPKSGHWADMTALEYERLQNRADAVIQCDALRADLVVQARRNESGDATDGHLTALDRAIWATRRQNEQTLNFLEDLTGYNMAIANYAIVTLSPSLPGDELAGKLVIAGSTLRDS